MYEADPADTTITGLEQLSDHDDLFQDLTARSYVKTNGNVVSMVMSYDSKITVAITTTTPEKFMVQAFGLKDHTMKFEKTFEGEYLRMNLVDQDITGQKFAVSYQDNGRFKIAMFTQQGEDIDHIDVNDILDLDTESKALSGFYEPLITVFFVPDS